MKTLTLKTFDDVLASADTFKKDTIITQEVYDAAVEYLKRQYRLSHPKGEFDSAGRFYPTGEEWEALDSVRSPSRAYPLSYMKACRSAEHVARLYKVHALSLKRIAKFINQE